MTNLVKFRVSPGFMAYNKHFKNIVSMSIIGNPELKDDELRSRARLAHIRAMEYAGKDLYNDSTAL